MILRQSRAGNRGFTLVELMIVVTIIGIITSIAIPFYLNFQTRAKQAEARSNLGAIRTAMVSYLAESDNFNVGNVGTMTYTAGDNTGIPFGQSSLARGLKMRWNPVSSFSVLGFTAEGAVYFNYSLETNTLNGDDASFTAMASADLNKNNAMYHAYLSEASVTLNQIGDIF